jgi:hypothetical protein
MPHQWRCSGSPPKRAFSRRRAPRLSRPITSIRHWQIHRTTSRPRSDMLKFPSEIRRGFGPDLVARVWRVRVRGFCDVIHLQGYAAKGYNIGARIVGVFPIDRAIAYKSADSSNGRRYCSIHASEHKELCMNRRPVCTVVKRYRFRHFIHGQLDWVSNTANGVRIAINPAVPLGERDKKRNRKADSRWRMTARTPQWGAPLLKWICSRREPLGKLVGSRIRYFISFR